MFVVTLKKQRTPHARLNTPTYVLIAAIGIVTTRCLDVVLLIDMIGISGLKEFVHQGIQTRLLQLIFFGGIGMLIIELCCALAIARGRNWGRWVFLCTQIIATIYLWSASLGYGYSELFRIPGETGHEILQSLVMQKLPDFLILFLLFVPPRTRLFFRR